MPKLPETVRVWRSATSNLMKGAYEYGSSFSRGTRATIRNDELGGLILFFLSGTASVDQKGKVFGRNLEQQVERMHKNYISLFKNALMTPSDVVHSAGYSKPRLLGRAQDIINGNHPYMVHDGNWYQSHVCRPGWKVEVDALAADGNFKDTKIQDILDLYALYHRRAMTGQPAEIAYDTVITGDLTFLFIYSFAETKLKKNDGICSRHYRNLVKAAYDIVTELLEQHEGSWLDVPNARINLPSMLTIPPGIDPEKHPDLPSQPDYYTIDFNPVRTDYVFRPASVGSSPEHPLPSSTGIGTIKYQEQDGLWAPISDRLVISMSTMAVIRAKR